MTGTVRHRGAVDVDLTRRGAVVDVTGATGDAAVETVNTIEPVGPVPREIAAAVLAVVGARRGDLILDLAPGGGLTTSLSAAVGGTGRVLAVGPGLTLPRTPAAANIRVVNGLEDVPDGSVSRIVLLAHGSPARAVVPLVELLRRVVLPGARMVVTSRPNTGGLADGLPAVLGACGLRVVHAEGVVTPDLRVALASALL